LRDDFGAGGTGSIFHSNQGTTTMAMITDTVSKINRSSRYAKKCSEALHYHQRGGVPQAALHRFETALTDFHHGVEEGFAALTPATRAAIRAR
jgi:hypothetical protein